VADYGFVSRALVVLALAALLGSAGSAAQPPRFVGTVARVTAADLPHSWRPGCPVGPAQLRLLRLGYWGFDGRPRVGLLVVRDRVARDVVTVFRRLYAARFPIRRLRKVDAYRGSDDASMAADNTSGFNCRFVSGTRRWSQHAYGEAIDVNPVENPYVQGDRVSPPAARRYLDRSNVRPGMAVAGGVLVRAFAAVGWRWGGRWSGSADYQHFSTSGS
jgi:D-alanyl-D-alanine carboxypeptidase